MDLEDIGKFFKRLKQNPRRTIRYSVALIIFIVIIWVSSGYFGELGRHLFISKKERPTANIKPKNSNIGPVEIVSSLSKAEPNVDAEPEKPDEKTSSITSLSPSEIIQKIKGYPLLQQEDAKKYYIGLRVKWDLTLVAIQKEGGDNVILFLGGEDSPPLIYCLVSLNNNRQLGILEKGAPIRVAGRICKIGHLLDIELDSVELEIK